jgi:hypothetical protein
MKSRFLMCKKPVMVLLAAIFLSPMILAQTNPVPLINQPLVPDAVTPGGQGFTLTVNGTGFVSGSVVNWNDSPLTTTFVSGAQLTASVPASDIAKASTASVNVVNPNPGGGASNVAFFPIALPNPSILLSSSDIPIGSAGPPSVATGDLNGDGKLDAVLPNFGNTVSILLGNGDGTFQPRVDYPIGNTPRDVVIADFNGDGKLDLAVTNNGSNTVSVLLGNGDGTFQPEVEYPTGSGSWAIATADFNKDGKLDLVVSNYYDGTISVLLGNGDGTFQPHVDYPTGSPSSTPVSIAIGDFNRDGELDLAVANRGDGTVSILQGKGDGTFSLGNSYPTGSTARWVAAADFNGDGYLDLAVVNDSVASTVLIFLGDSNGTFQPHVDYPIGGPATAVIVGDFNGDGKLDLASANFSDGGGNTVSILLGNGDGTFQTHVEYMTGSGPDQLAAADFNGDGRLDLAVANQVDGTASVLLQATTISLSPSSLNFGIQVVGTQSPAQKVTLTNTGKIALTISSIAVTGTDKTDFVQQNNCGKGLAPGASCTIGVAFTPTQLGPRTAAVTITDNVVGSPQSVPLSGFGVTSGPNATLSPTSLAFSTQLVGTTSPSQPVTLTNYGSQTLHITGGSISSDFGQTDNCSANLAPAASCTINVTFTPRQRGTRNGTLSIKDNAPNSPQTVSLQGTGTVVELNPGSLNFGTVTVGQSSQPQTTTLTNVGSLGLQITNITITGSDPNDFSQNNTCGGGVGAGQSCTITVTFTPTQAGSRSADVSISDNGGASPQQVSLSGTGQAILKCGSRCTPWRNECPQTCHSCLNGGQGYVCSRQTSSLLNDSLLERNEAVAVACGK